MVHGHPKCQLNQLCHTAPAPKDEFILEKNKTLLFLNWKPLDFWIIYSTTCLGWRPWDHEWARRHSFSKLLVLWLCHLWKLKLLRGAAAEIPALTRKLTKGSGTSAGVWEMAVSREHRLYSPSQPASDFSPTPSCAARKKKISLSASVSLPPT